MAGFPIERNWVQPTWPPPYGLAPMPGGQVVYPPPPSPQALAAQGAVNHVVGDAARGLLVNTTETPIHAPPYRALPFPAERRVVVQPPGSPPLAGPLAAAVALAAAEAPFSGPLPLIALTSTSVFADVYSYTIPNGFRLVITKVGLGAPLAPKDALRWRLVVGTLPLVAGLPAGTGSDGLWPRASADDLLDTFAVPMANTTVSVQVRNLNVNSGYLVEVKLYGWLFPVLQQDDNERSLLLTNGLDTNGRFTDSGAFCAPACPSSMVCPPPGPCPPCGPTSCA